jgi:hypothetical protein
MSARLRVVATPVVAGARVVVTAVVAGVVDAGGRVVVTLNGGSVTVDALSSPPPHPAASATTAQSAAVRVVARLACMPAH